MRATHKTCAHGHVRVWSEAQRRLVCPACNSLKQKRFRANKKACEKAEIILDSVTHVRYSVFASEEATSLMETQNANHLSQTDRSRNSQDSPR